MASSERGFEPALVCVSTRHRSSRRGRPLPTYAVYVDGRAVGSSPYWAASAIVLPEGPHSVQVKMSPWASDIVELELRGGDHVELFCGTKSLIQGKFWKTVETKFLWFFVPLVLIAYYFPAVGHFVEQNLKYEFLALLGLLCIGTAIGFLRMFSRKPGAMLSLVQTKNFRDDEPLEGDACDATLAAVKRLVASDARLFVALPRSHGFDLEGIQNAVALDITPANLPFPLIVLAVLAAVDTCVVLYFTHPWIPPKPSWTMLIIAPVNGVLIGLLLGLQTILIAWVRNRLRGKLAAMNHESPSTRFPDSGTR